MKSKTFLMIIIVVLVLLNIGTLTFMWINKPDRHMLKIGPDPTGFLIEKLLLDNKQIAVMKQQRMLFRAEMAKLQFIDHDLHKKFFDHVLQSPSDTFEVIGIADAIAVNRMSMEMLTFRHFSELRSMLNKTQQIKFDTVLFDALKTMLPPPQSPPPPPPPTEKNH